MIKTESADAYKDKDGCFVFPFDVLDKTPGGSNLGRIQVQLEFIRGPKTKEGRYMIEKILLLFRQTRDPRYVGKTFEIPCYSDAVLGDSLERQSYLNYVWRVMFCEIHKEMFFDAYPANHHKALKINVGSSMGIDVDFI